MLHAMRSPDHSQSPRMICRDMWEEALVANLTIWWFGPDRTMCHARTRNSHHLSATQSKPNRTFSHNLPLPTSEVDERTAHCQSSSSENVQKSDRPHNPAWSVKRWLRYTPIALHSRTDSVCFLQQIWRHRDDLSYRTEYSPLSHRVAW